MLVLEAYSYSKTNTNRRVIERRVCIICAIILMLIASLRGDSVGTDTISYVKDYSRVALLSYKDILLVYSDNPGYYLLSKFFVDHNAPIQLWFGFVELIYISAVYKVIKTFSKDKALSFLLFFFLGCYSFSLSGLKQTVAMGIALWAFICLYNKRNLWFFLLLGLGFFFHKSCIVFLFTFIIFQIKDSRKLYFYLTIAFVGFVLLYDRLTSMFINTFGNEHYKTYLQSESRYSATTFLVFLFLFLLALLFYKRYYFEKENEATLLLGMTYLGLITLPIAFAVASAFRISLYYSVFLDVFLPNCISYASNYKNRLILKLSIVAFLLFYFIYSNRNGGSVVPYVFFWQ